eukprot:316806-Prorocentrum_minimum.AAC.1
MQVNGVHGSDQLEASLNPQVYQGYSTERGYSYMVCRMIAGYQRQCCSRFLEARLRVFRVLTGGVYSGGGFHSGGVFTSPRGPPGERRGGTASRASTTTPSPAAPPRPPARSPAGRANGPPPRRTAPPATFGHTRPHSATFRLHFRSLSPPPRAAPPRAARESTPGMFPGRRTGRRPPRPSDRPPPPRSGSPRCSPALGRTGGGGACGCQSGCPVWGRARAGWRGSPRGTPGGCGW